MTNLSSKDLVAAPGLEPGTRISDSSVAFPSFDTPLSLPDGPVIAAPTAATAARSSIDRGSFGAGDREGAPFLEALVLAPVPQLAGASPSTLTSSGHSGRDAIPPATSELGCPIAVLSGGEVAEKNLRGGPGKPRRAGSCEPVTSSSLTSAFYARPGTVAETRDQERALYARKHVLRAENDPAAMHAHTDWMDALCHLSTAEKAARR